MIIEKVTCLKVWKRGHNIKGEAVTGRLGEEPQRSPSEHQLANCPRSQKTGRKFLPHCNIATKCNIATRRRDNAFTTNCHTLPDGRNPTLQPAVQTTLSQRIVIRCQMVEIQRCNPTSRQRFDNESEQRDQIVTKVQRCKYVVCLLGNICPCESQRESEPGSPADANRSRYCLELYSLRLTARFSAFVFRQRFHCCHGCLGVGVGVGWGDVVRYRF